MLAIHDGPPEVGGGIYVSDGDRCWGVPSEAYLLDYFFSGLMKHGGTMRAETFFGLRDRDGKERKRGAGAASANALQEEGVLRVNGLAMTSINDFAEQHPDIEGGNPCG